MARILVVDDEEGIRSFVATALGREGHNVETAADGSSALALFDQKSFDLVITDLKMHPVDGMAVVAKVRADRPETEVIVLTAYGTVETAVEAMRRGAFDFIQKPIESPAALRLIVARALERRALLTDRERNARRETGSRIELTFGDPAMRPVVEAIEKVAVTHASVLLLGESGTGKEVAARAIHERSPRADGPFVAINCATLSETLLESELLGHEKGAFTGAHAQRRGRVELAEGGTVFLDEIGELAPTLQARLLRLLQERRFERIGGTRTIDANVRWIAATNRDLGARMASGQFREDLYHRLAVFPIRLPPLRDRPGDIAPIAKALLVGISRDLGSTTLTLSDSAVAKLVAYDWPGNVRELRNALERAAILASGSQIDVEQLWLDPTPRVASAGNVAAVATASAAASPRSLDEVERETILQALASCGNNRKQAADVLGIGLRTLYEKLKRYGIR